MPGTPDKPAPAAKKRGRPTKYTEAVAKEILGRLADGQSLSSICKDAHLPDKDTVLDWSEDSKSPFSRQYARARLRGYMKHADELTDIADDGRNDWMDRELKNGDTIRVVDEECVKRSQLRVDTRKWILARMLPKVYGDKLDVKHEAGADFRKFLEAAASGKFRRGKVDPKEDDNV